MKEIRLCFVKRHPDAKLPCQVYSDFKTGDTGYDLTCVEGITVKAGNSGIVLIGLDVGYITPGYWFRIEVRSGLGFKNDLTTHFGVIDNQFRGNLDVKIYNQGKSDYTFKKGDRIAQLVVYKLYQPKISWMNIEDVKETKRGIKGIGSTDKVKI